ncbi:LysE family translocator [Shewanella dokdonensis]|uniref:LysE family translocator n=1 Tax=Shewanella dokdonensis TaxID=712036 RepID=A0ABX8DFB2_9GAMM|nr:LysE family translocator [Shewanella dokdonensis]MCL1074987.1 LysE family translocator [Shewanella dokdonensis]QVK23417.1 LysE family translocator [Shewanella dokdonensis]
MDYFYAMLLFAVSSSVTPGPNNLLVMASGVNFGIRRSLPLLSGICFGFTLMLLLVSIGFYQLFVLFPSLQWLLKAFGCVYLLYLSWLIARSGTVTAADDTADPLGFMKGLLFQWVNVKAWIVAVGAIAAFTSGGDGISQQLLLALVFLLVSFPCVGVWLLFGTVLQHWLASEQRRHYFNGTMAALLALSIIPVLMELAGYLFPALAA